MKRMMILLCLGAVAGQGLAQLPRPEREPVVGARMPALNPNGSRLAFVYRGDVWVTDSESGRARAVARHVEMDSFPCFSPDGQWIAFASKRNGDWDIFAVPADGGEARQLTYHGGPELPSGWSSDGREILFSAKRDSPNYGVYALDVATLGTRLLCEDYAPLRYPAFSSDHRMVVYGRYGFHWTRPRYSGSAAAQIWLLNLESGNRFAVTRDEHQHLWPQFLPDGKHLVTVTVGEETPATSKMRECIGKVEDNAERTPNLWRFDLEGYGLPLTHFVGGGVRWPSVAARRGDVAFEYGTDIWVLRKGRSEPVKMKLYADADEKQTTRRRESLTGGVTEAEPSPDGETYLFGLRGDMWTVAMEKPEGFDSERAEFARRLTTWVGDDSDFSWSHDGKRVYFTSDREFNTRIYELDLETLETKSLWDRKEDVTGLRLSPDGLELGFWVAGSEGGLHLLKLKDGTVRRLVKVPGPQWRGAGGGEYEWSPDMKWMAYTHRGESGAWNIWVTPLEGDGEPVNLTHLYAHHSQPAWSPDGKYLFFQSNRDGDGLYVLPLQEEPVRTADTDFEFERVEDVEVKIDFNDISRRIRKVASQNPQSSLTVTRNGEIIFGSGGDVWSVSYDGKSTKRLTSGGNRYAIRVSANGKRIYYIQKGELWTMTIDGKGARKISFRAEWERDVREERQAAFTQFWRSYHRGFYDGNFHGRDWEAIRDRYEPMLEGVETEDEFASVLQMMVGELETSHSEVKAKGGGVSAPVTPHLGFTFDPEHGGPGIRVREVPEGAPGSYEKTRIKPGEYVLEINGHKVSPDEHLYDLINNRQGRIFEFRVSAGPDGSDARTVKYKVLSSGEWESLRYRNRVHDLRKRVEEESGGKVGYLHIPSMGQSDQARFEREAYEYIAGKEAMIIDVRFNNGGNIADTLVDWMERKPHGFVRARDSEPRTSPTRAWVKPVVVLMNEHSYSNAEIFSYAMRERNLARLVGMPTPGYVIWTDSLSLVDGTGARMPQSGFYRMDGTTQENDGEQPDVRVELSPEDWLSGRDPQLEKAIEMLRGALVTQAGGS